MSLVFVSFSSCPAMLRFQPCVAHCGHGISALVAVRRKGRDVALGVGRYTTECIARSGQVQTRQKAQNALPLGSGIPVDVRPSVWNHSRWFRGHTMQRRPAGPRVACAGAPPSEAPDSSGRKKLVFLGTPDVAAVVLRDLVSASIESQTSAETTPWEVSAVVTQPGRPKGRGKVAQPSPVHSAALELGIPESRIFCPIKASEKEFLSSLDALSPDVCVTAAYGNYLPTSFLNIPVHGTLNIHPSLLPLYRGAAPVQRSLEDGVRKSGVTVLFTVKEMDAGPIVCQAEFEVGENATSTELLDSLFRLGTKRLIACLPQVWDGRVQEMVRAQDHELATHAGKIGRDEGRMRFEQAEVEHNKARAFHGWPGTYGTFLMVGEQGKEEEIEIKVLETRVRPGSDAFPEWDEPGEGQRVVLDKAANAMVLRCADGCVLELRRLQSPGKKPVDAKSFGNGLGGRKLYWRSSFH